MREIFCSNRELSRASLARDIAKCSKTGLYKYGITRVGCVGYLDRIGLPIYCSMRPGASTISINSGKSVERDMARAGAILEAIEVWSAENPTSSYLVSPEAKLSDQHLPFDEWPTAKESIVTKDHPIAWELCDTTNNDQIWVPSDVINLVQRAPTPFLNFQSTTNGLASGVTYRDACLSGLYEVVERDAWTLSDVARDQCQIWPMRVSLEDLPSDLEQLVSAIYRADLFPVLYDVTSDLRVPAFSCTIYDPNIDSVGSFGGYGCHLNAITAIKRSIMEAIQSRAVYISGARDDLLRRSFLITRKANQEKLIKQVSALPVQGSVWNYRPVSFETVEQEWEALVALLAQGGITKIYTKEMQHIVDDFECSIARVVCPELETAHFEHYQPGKRALSYFKSLTNTI